MYDLVDRRVDGLAVADRLLLDAMRGWVHALTLAGNPRGAVAGRFADTGAAFDAAMRLLDAGSTETIALQRPCHAVVEEDEAVLLGLWRLVLADRDAAALATARALVGAQAGAMVEAMRRVAVRAPLPH